jgi:putative transposase
LLKAYQYRLYPTKHQETILKDTLEYCRYIYNETLALRKREWEENKKTISYFECSKILTQWKKEKPILNMVYAQVLQEVQVRVDLAYKAFFRRVKRGEKPGYPRFKGVGRYDSITYTQLGFKLVKNGLVYLSKIGKVEFKQHRKLKGKIKRLVIKRHGFNKWFISFVCEIDDIKNTERINQRSIGIDVGLNHFLTQSNGQKKENPRFYRKEEKALKKAQRQFSKTKKGSFERIKKVKVLKRVYERISNKRKDYCHKASNSLIKKYRIICVEDLNIKNMISRNSGMNKSINDVAWNMFFNYLEYKAEEAGIQIVKIDPRNTSKTCSRCLCVKDKLGLEDRIYYCLWCGLEEDRDINASKNILRLGLQSLG